jgi:hypothetical protein
VNTRRSIVAISSPEPGDGLFHLVDRDFSAKWMDLGMLVDNTGRERTAEEYRDLLRQSGFEMSRVVPTASVFSLVEAKPV